MKEVSRLLNISQLTKTYHVNLLKKFHVRSEELTPRTSDDVGGPLLETVCSAIIEATDDAKEATSDDGLLERIQRAGLTVRPSKCLVGAEALGLLLAITSVQV